MSMILCDRCDAMIDSDDDPGCFCDVPDYFPANLRGALRTEIVCEPCREKDHERLMEALMENGA